MFFIVILFRFKIMLSVRVSIPRLSFFALIIVKSLKLTFKVFVFPSSACNSKILSVEFESPDIV